MRRSKWCGVVLSTLVVSAPAMAVDSQCYGTVSRGRIEHSVQLPARGANFNVYSTIGMTAGRTHVHAKVADVVVSTYDELARTRPSTVYVYGETGFTSGGRIRPHRTHQNGLSVDFFVPVRDAQGRSVPLPTTASNKLGYGIEFDAAGRYGEYTIDFDALAEHLYTLQRAAQAKGVGISLVIVDADYLPRLLATPRGPALQALPFMKGKPWIRHDEHYHVDFGVACKAAG